MICIIYAFRAGRQHTISPAGTRHPPRPRALAVALALLLATWNAAAAPRTAPETFDYYLLVLSWSPAY